MGGTVSRIRQLKQSVFLTYRTKEHTIYPMRLYQHTIAGASKKRCNVLERRHLELLFLFWQNNSCAGLCGLVRDRFQLRNGCMYSIREIITYISVSLCFFGEVYKLCWESSGNSVKLYIAKLLPVSLRIFKRTNNTVWRGQERLDPWKAGEGHEEQI